MSLYSDLLKKCLINVIYKESEPYDTMYGMCWPKYAHTMIGIKRLVNLEECICNVLEAGVPGDLIETGVWRGGATILMRGLLKERDIKDRFVWVADSFQGFRKSTAPQDVEDWTDLKTLAVGLDEVKRGFDRYELLDGQVRFVEGWFEETLPAPGMSKFAVLRLDCDYYSSTMCVLEKLYDMVSNGGYVIVDDYGAFLFCRQAVDEFRSRRGITTPLTWVDQTCVWWQK